MQSSNVHDYEDRPHFDASVYDKEYFEGDGSKSGYRSYADARRMVRDQYKIIDDVMSVNVDFYSAMDVGCAYGYGCEYLTEHKWETVGLDISEHAINKAKELHPELMFDRVDIVELARKTPMEDVQRNFGLVTAVELFEHIETKDVDVVLDLLSRSADWGFFVINGRTFPGQPLDSNHGDHGHLNNHSMSWWISKISEYGEIDFDSMFQFSKEAERVHPEVNWHNRAVVVKFNQDKEA